MIDGRHGMYILIMHRHDEFGYFSGFRHEAILKSAKIKIARKQIILSDCQDGERTGHCCRIRHEVGGSVPLVINFETGI